ncbi:MAG: ABC transporter permease [Gaiellaceae bacterium]
MIAERLAQDGPVIPDFGRGSECVTENRFFCWDWATEHWDDTLQPRLLEHVELTVYAVGIGFAIAFAAALIAYRFRWFEGPFGLFSAFLYTVPSLALFQLLVPITGLTVTTVEIALVGYTLLILFRNILAGLRGVPEDVLEAARGMGLTRAQTLTRIELPLALPAVLAGVRIATVSTISLATIAAFILPEGLGAPILDGLRNFFKTKFIAAGLLAVGLALVADAVLVLLGRLVTPWATVRRVA